MFSEIENNYLSSIKPNAAVNADCLEALAHVEDESIDMILCDLPYGSTAAKWDKVIDFEALWAHYERIVKDHTPIVLTATQPFAALMITSNIRWFRHEWIWVKNTKSGMMSANKAPMRRHENILVFSKKSPKFNAQKVLGSETSRNHSKKQYNYKNYKSTLYATQGGTEYGWNEYVHPDTVITCKSVGNRSKEKIHPTQKPLDLFKYLIKTYTNEGDIVLDNCAGSFTTALAASHLNRRWICIEKDNNYYRKGVARIKDNCKILFND